MTLVDDMNHTIRVVAGCRYVVRSLCCPACNGPVELSESSMGCLDYESCCWASSKFASYGGLQELSVSP